MSANTDLRTAIHLLTQGDRKKAAAILLRINGVITDGQTRLEFIDASLSALDPLDQNDRLCDLALEGISIARGLGQENLVPHFMARRANLLMMKVAAAHHSRASLSLAPSWIAFSTEQDLRRYESLTSDLERLEKEVDDLLGNAVRIAEQRADERLLGFVLMDRGSVTSSRYLQYKSDYLRNPIRAKAWVQWRMLRYPLFERFGLFSRAQGRLLNALVKSFTSDFLRAAALFGRCGDPQGASA